MYTKLRASLWAMVRFVSIIQENIGAHSAAQHLHYVQISVLHGSIVLKHFDTFDDDHMCRWQKCNQFMIQVDARDIRRLTPTASVLKNKIQ